MNDTIKSGTPALEDESSFEAIQSNFQKVILALVNDNSLDAFRIEYEKLFTALENSHACNQQLIERIRALNREINENSSKVQSALRYSQEDQKTINILRRDFEKAWQTVEALHARESRSKEIISALKAELLHLSELAEKQGAIDTIGPQKKLEDDIDQLKDEVKSNNQLIKSLQTQLDTSRNNKKTLIMKMESLNNIKDDLEHELVQSSDEIKSYDNESVELSNSIEETKQQNQNSQENYDQGSIIMDKKQKLIEQYNNELKKSQQSVTEFGLTIRYHQGKATEYQKKLDAKKKSVDLLIQQKDQLLETVEDKKKIVDELNSELNKINNQRQKIDQLLSEFTQVHKERTSQIAQLKQQINTYRKERLAINRSFDSQETKIKSCQRAILTSQQNISKVEDNCQKEKDEAKFCKAQSEVLKNDLLKNKKDQGSYRQTISEIEDEIASTESELSITRNNVTSIEMETQKYKNEIFSLQKEMKEISRQKQSTELAIKEISEHHEVDSRQYLQLRNENQTIENDLRFLKLNVTEFREAVTKADNQCMEVLANRRICEEQTKKLSNDIKQIKQNIEDANSNINKIENERMTKAFILNQSKNACTEIKQQMNNMRDNASNIEREIGKRTNELEALREKARIISSTFSKSGLRYTETTEDIERMKSELSREIEKQHALISKREYVEKLKREVARVEKNLVISQTQYTMLTEEAKKPISIHRWRLLESANPLQFEQIQMRTALLDKITTLLNQERKLQFQREEYQKRISHKTTQLKGKRDVSEIEAYKKLDQLYKEKINKLNSLSQKTEKVKEEANEWRDRVNYKESLIIEQKEQFYITKQREVAVSYNEESAKIREPRISFNRGQAPRSIVPRLKIIEPKSNDRGKKTTRGIKNNPRNIVGKRKPIIPLLPPLVPKTVR